MGLDCGHETHAFALQDRSGHAEAGTLKHSAESLHHWLTELAKRYGGRPISLAIEASRGAVIHGLLQYPWLTIYPVNPVTSARYRTAFTPSGAKDDLPDAHVLQELVRDHAHRPRSLEAQDPQTQKLAYLVEVRCHLVDRRTQLLNQLTSLLKDYYPQDLELMGTLNSDLAVDFIFGARRDWSADRRVREKFVLGMKHANPTKPDCPRPCAPIKDNLSPLPNFATDRRRGPFLLSTR
jgi:hypothetical protein